MKYKVSEPIVDGFAYYRVYEPESPIMPNFTHVEIYKDTPDAATIAADICDALNGWPSLRRGHGE